jgi:hypothetical protein
MQEGNAEPADSPLHEEVCAGCIAKNGQSFWPSAACHRCLSCFSSRELISGSLIDLMVCIGGILRSPILPNVVIDRVSGVTLLSRNTVLNWVEARNACACKTSDMEASTVGKAGPGVQPHRGA